MWDKRTKSTLFHAAAWKLNNEIITLLLGNGLEVNTKDSKGHTPLYYAMEYKEIAGEVIKLLKKHGGKE